MSECTHDCSSCSQNCSSRQEPESFLAKPHKRSSVHKVIGVVSGKGGVGKSLVTSSLAVLMNRRGYHTAVLDADITGPSIPQAFGIHQHAQGCEDGLLPSKTETGIDVMSINLLLDSETTPVVWRGSMISSAVKQFWTDVVWQNVDYMFVDMPPGTGDVPLTVFQSLPIDGIIVVTSPQELVSMIVTKAVRMAEMMEVPVLGIVENMSYFVCPDCGKQIKVFGESHIDEIAKKQNLKVVGRIPMNPEIAKLCDDGRIEDIQGDFLEDACDAVEKAEKRKIKG